MKLNKRIAFSLVGLGLGATVLTGYKQADNFFEITKNIEIFASLFKEVNTYYVDGVNPNKFMKSGIDAMLNSLDPYTDYIPEDEIEDYRTMTTGQYGGIGAIVSNRGKKITIAMPFEGWPAHTAGLKIGDELLEIDGNSLVNKNTNDVSKMLKGQAGTPVKLKVKRFGQKEPFLVTLTRQKIKVNAVPYSGMVDSEIGYLRLSDFTQDCSKEVKKAIEDLKSKGAKQLIFDVRDNPGGLLMEAINICNFFVPMGMEVVSTKGKVAEWNKSYRALNPPLDLDIPVVVLTSSRSASASEIVSGVLQDYDRGVLVGAKTFGKGLVQATRPLSYNAQLKVTTAKYYIPSGRCIQAIDYANRNADGSVGKIADSLKKAFTTTAGRKVYDGGGVTPDILVERVPFAPITISLEAKNLFFDYAIEYAAAHPTIKAAKDFALSDEEYEAFVKWLGDKDYDYTTEVENNIKKIEEAAKKDKTLDQLKSRIDELRKSAMHSKEKDLMTHKNEIREVLESQIVSHYYLDKGVIEASFDNDEDILAAVKVLKDKPRFDSILKGKK